MARIRYLKPDFFKDEDLSLLPHVTRLFYAGLWTQADKEGRLEDRPKRLLIELFPYDKKVNINTMLDQLAQRKNGSIRPFIVRYEIEGEKYIQILKWNKHQKPHHTEQPSSIPEPPKEVMERLSNGETTVPTQEGMGMEKGMEKGMGSVATPPNHDHNQFIKYFTDKFTSKCNTKYSFNREKDGKLVKQLLRDHSLDESKRLVDMFFATDDSFIINAGYTIGVFYSQINKFKSKLHKVDPSIAKILKECGGEYAKRG